MSAIDFILVNEKARRQVKDMWVDESRQIDVMSDHHMLVMTYRCGREETRTETRTTCTHWKVRGVDWDDYKKDLE